MSAVLQAESLGKRYGSNWALEDCSFTLKQGQVAALVGPNGAGKSTLLELAIGLLKPTQGTLSVMGGSPVDDPQQVLPRVGFVAQEHPLYRSFSVQEMLRFGREMNPRWDGDFALSRIRQIGLPLGKKTGELSGGQQAQVALVLALAKRPDLILLDEPIAALDPLARREFLQVLMDGVVETGASVLMSSHILGDLERVCDSVLLLSGGRIQLDGEIEEILATHRRVIGPVQEEMLASCVHEVIHRSRSEKQVSSLVRLNGPLVLGDAWTVHEPSLEDIVLAYLERRDVHVDLRQGVLV
ncbi:MAG TPA: ABC transporter ATP-binding protein [Dehalococcoidia bacterium]|nr:ABC transporter ATP-binding protein [Dehalococcoidia bacterium]